MRSYYVYILSNRYRTVLYTGITNDLERRLSEHRSGTGGGFSAKYRTHDLLYFEEYPRPSDAISREKEIKGWRREKKLSLIQRLNPDLVDLSADW